MSEFAYQAKDAVIIHLLNEVYGDEVTLTDQGEEVVYSIAKEFRLGDRDYAVLLSGLSEEEYMLFRIVRDASGGLELETIMDDDEWEAVAEVYDEMTFEP